MSKLTSIFLLFNYLIFSVGLTVPVHHCKMTGKVSYFNTGKSCCQKFAKKICPAKKTKKSGCCEDKFITYKIEKSQKSQVSFSFKLPVSSVSESFVSEIYLSPIIWETIEKTAIPNYVLPPPKIPLYLQNGVLII